MLRLFSADDHLIEHPRVWADRLPSRYVDVGPRVVVDDDGCERWVYDDKRGQLVKSLSGAPPDLGERAHANAPRDGHADSYSAMLAGSYDPAARAKDMHANGVVASVCFPSVPRFAGTLFVRFKDKVLADLCVKAYNDFVLDEWCAGGPPGMFVPMTLCQLWDVHAAVEEIIRCVDKGARAISFPENVVYFDLPSFYTDHWDPLWQVCEETGTVICMHLGTGGNLESFRASPEAPDDQHLTVASITASATALMNLVFSPVCTKFPGLKFVFSESGIGWLPYAIERADMFWDRHQGSMERPSDIWRRNMFVCQLGERVGLQMVDNIGADKILWELDYPHPDTVWPFSQEHTAEVFEVGGLSEEEIELITHKNSERLFRWTAADVELTAPGSPG